MEPNVSRVQQKEKRRLCMQRRPEMRVTCEGDHNRTKHKFLAGLDLQTMGVGFNGATQLDGGQQIR
jgi:hypothetical protein